MTIKIRIPKASGGEAGKRIRGLPRDPVLRAALVAFLILAVSFTVFFSYFYIKYDRIIEKRFRSPVFANSAKIYALPQDGARWRADPGEGDCDGAAAGRVFGQRGAVDAGHFPSVEAMGSRSRPGRSRTTARSRRASRIQDGQVDQISSKGNDLSAYELEPQLVTALFDAEQRSKRELVKYDDIPPHDGAGGAGDRGPALLRAQRREFSAHGGSGVDRRDARAARAGRIDADACSFRADSF